MAELEPIRDERLDMLVRDYELRLIRCTLSSSPSCAGSQKLPSDGNIATGSQFRSLIEGLLALIESGRYLKVLNSDAVRMVFELGHDSPELFDNSVDCAGRVYSELMKRVESFIKGGSDNEAAKTWRAMIVMCIAISAFLGFTQCNVTGPLEKFPKCPLPLKVLKGNEFGEWDNWARNQLMSAGSDLLGKFSNLEYIVFAKMLLMRIRDLLYDGSISSVNGIRSISWWFSRVLLLQQRILNERSSSLFDLLHVFMGEAIHHFGTSEKVISYWGNYLHDSEALAIVSMIHLEAGIMEYVYGRVDACRLHFESAEVAAGLQLSVTGALGFRTVHQVEPKAQMVLVSNTSYSGDGDSSPLVSPNIQTHCSGSGEDNLHLHQNETCEVSDILMTPKLLEMNIDSENRSKPFQNGDNGSTSLTAIQQAVILAQCLLIEKSARQDEMQRWDMAPYIEAIDAQNLSCFIIQSFCHILRVRWESTRSRTKERALMMMDKMVQGVYESSPGVTQRLLFSYGAYIPTIPALRKEYGELIVRCGLIGEALKIFEDLELWDNLIYCFCLLEKKATAVDLIKKRLDETPNDPRLWCSLGDCMNNDACYEKALQVSHNRSVRAKRSLARSAYNRKDYEKSKILWESAMAMNSMYPDGWFALGAAALKARDVEKALEGFTRAVHLDPESGEAWNNIACLHMMRNKSKEAFIAFKEALKFKRNSSEIWENFSHVAMDVGNVGQALEAIKMVLDLTDNRMVDTTLLERIMGELEKRASANQPISSLIYDQKYTTDFHIEIHKDYGVEAPTAGRSQETEQLMFLLGKVLQQIVRRANGCGPDVWGLYARWHKMNGDLIMCSEALLKQVRSLQGSDMWNNEDRFRKFSKASTELCKVYMEISTSTGSHKELFTAEMHLKNIIKQAHNFTDSQEFADLQVCFDEVKMKLNALTT